MQGARRKKTKRGREECKSRKHRGVEGQHGREKKGTGGKKEKRKGKGRRQGADFLMWEVLAQVYRDLCKEVEMS